MHVFRDMMSVKATPGEDAELSCEITKPEAFIRWLKNGHQIRHSPPKYKISVEKHLVRLVITNTCIRDSGEYCCEADGIATRAKLEVRGKYWVVLQYFCNGIVLFSKVVDLCHMRIRLIVTRL